MLEDDVASVLSVEEVSGEESFQPPPSPTEPMYSDTEAPDEESKANLRFPEPVDPRAPGLETVATSSRERRRRKNVMAYRAFRQFTDDEAAQPLCVKCNMPPSKVLAGIKQLLHAACSHH